MTPAQDHEGTEDPWGDDLWGDEDSTARPTQLYLQIGLVVVIVAIIAAVVILRSDDTDTAGDQRADGATSATSATSAAAGPGDATAPTGQPQPSGPAWPPEINGRPDAFGELEGSPTDAPGGADPGVYIWNDFDGWHLWVVNGDDVQGVSGSITGNDAIASAEVVPEGSGTATPTDTQIEFDLPAEPEIVGINFNPGFYANSLVVSIDGSAGPLPAEFVHLGQNLAPAENPVVIVQTPAS